MLHTPEPVVGDQLNILNKTQSVQNDQESVLVCRK
jgi:hypothetical protein